MSEKNSGGRMALENRIQLVVRNDLLKAEEEIRREFPEAFQSHPGTDTIVGTTAEYLEKRRTEYSDALAANVRYAFWKKIPDDVFSEVSHAPQ